jgi:hypothetical protein
MPTPFSASLRLCQTGRRPLVQHARTPSDRQPCLTAASDRFCEYGPRPLQVAGVKKLMRLFTVLRPGLDFVKLVRQQGAAVWSYLVSLNSTF